VGCVWVVGLWVAVGDPLLPQDGSSAPPGSERWRRPLGHVAAYRLRRCRLVGCDRQQGLKARPLFLFSSLQRRFVCWGWGVWATRPTYT
jgi:hypothetical protein